MQPTSSKQPLERLITVGMIVAALLAAIAASVIGGRFGGASTAGDANAIADSLASAIGKGTPAQSLLDTFAAAGTIRSATIYGANGEQVAATGTPSPNVEQVFRSLPNGGSLSIEPGAAARSGSTLSEMLRPAAIAAVAAMLIALVIGSLMTRALRRRLDVLRAGIDEVHRDTALATRVPVEAGALRPLTASLNKLVDEMQQRELSLRRRTNELEAANKDLEGFAATVSHDLRAPVGSISGFAQALDEDYGPQLDDMGRECIHWIRHSATQMNNIIEGMLQMARLTRVEVHRTEVDITRMARDIAATLQRANPTRDVEFVIRDGIVANGDEKLLRAVLENLIGNAFKFTGKRPGARIEIGARDDAGTMAFYVRDNGAGFAPEHAAKMFRPFQRLHSEKEFAGTGIGLATVHRIVQRHGGRVWAEGEPEKGATIYFTTGTAEEWAA